MTKEYRLDPIQRTWSAEGSTHISYSDGDEAEDYLYAVLRRAADVSAGSQELAEAVKDWPSEYHLSPVRHNLLRHLDLKSTDQVLELGCGCGAMTRFLGETGATVIAVEGSHRRARIAAERCRDLPNVTVYCDTIGEFETSLKFDYVTLIGVLEYAPLFFESADPVGSCLRKAQGPLKEDGVLVLAIENQLGLKYFNGCAEDHAGLPYFGINDLYGAGTAITFGKHELKSRLRSTGLASVDFFYPFPDYKVPNLILAEAAFERPDFMVGDLLFRSTSREYGGAGSRAFHENLAWQPLARNGLVGELANSFLILACKAPARDQSQPRWLARTYSSGRLPAYETATIFLPDENKIAVVKHSLFPEAARPERTEGLHLRHKPALHAPYVSGRLYGAELQPIMARGGGPAAVARWAAPWVARLVAAATPNAESVMVVPGALVDAIPSNLVRDNSGNFADIDLEWEADAPVPLAWILVRGLVNAMTVCPVSPAFAGLSVRDCVIQVLEQLDHPVSSEDFQMAAVLENNLHDMVFGQDRKSRPFSVLMEEPICSVTSPPTYRDEIADLRKEIVRVKATVSWRLTAPLRAAYNLLHRTGKR
jgi:SAM-dependent methyltransferase